MSQPRRPVLPELAQAAPGAPLATASIPVEQRAGAATAPRTGDQVVYLAAHESGGELPATVRAVWPDGRLSIDVHIPNSRDVLTLTRVPLGADGARDRGTCVRLKSA